MDPLSALALAGNIVQFVDYGTKLFSNARELYKSSVGTLDANNELELVTADLAALIAKLRTTFGSGALDPDNVEAHQQSSFGQLCDEAAMLAEEILARLDKLKNKNQKHKAWHSLQKVIASAWSEKEVASLKSRLLGFREALETRVLFSIKENLDSDSIRLSSRFDSLDQQTQQILSAILDSSNASTAKISRDLREQMMAQTIAFTQVLSRIESLNQDQHHKVRTTIYREISADVPFGAGDEDEIQGITAKVEMLGVSDVAEAHVRSAIHGEILQSLRYPTMSSRYEDVLEPHPETFEWAFHESLVNNGKWNCLSDWLESDGGIYWIGGKAGSGKSTLMKHLLSDERTLERLKIWAKDKPFCVASFFFWNSGTKEQKSHSGLLRALLFQVLESYPTLTPVVLPVLWAKLYSKAICGNGKKEESIDDWSVLQLMRVFRAFIRQKNVALKIFFAIDGLDEFDGDHEEIARLFQDISGFNNIKVCLSSRPWVVFEQIFDNIPSLRLQHLTYPDIERYVRDNLMENTFFQRLANANPEDAPALMQEIVNKADGVFLWVKLVVKSLLNGIRNRDEMCHLWERLRLLPRELEPLYSRLLELIEPLYMPWVSKAFQILQKNRDLVDNPFGESTTYTVGVERVSVAAFYLAMDPELDPRTIIRMGSHELGLKLNSRCKDTVVHLTARCAGFLEVSGTGRDAPIVFFHRTARDFLSSDIHWSKLRMQTMHIDFNPCVVMMRSCILQALVNYILHQIINKEKAIPFAEKSPANVLPTCKMDSVTTALAKDFLIYIHNASDDTKTAATQTVLFDQFSSIMDTSWSIKIYTSLRGFPNLLEIAALFNLKSYLASKIPQETEEKTKRIATDVLRYLLPDQDCHVKYGIPFPRNDIVLLLLQLGADPNDRGPSKSVWENTLRFSYAGIKTAQLANGSSSDLDESFDFVADNRITYDPKLIQIRYLQIMETLVLSGANPEFCVSSRDIEDSYSALNLTENFLVKEFPLEATPLLKALQDKLKMQKSTISWKRRRSESSCCGNTIVDSKRRAM